MVEAKIFCVEKFLMCFFDVFEFFIFPWYHQFILAVYFQSYLLQSFLQFIETYFLFLLKLLVKRLFFPHNWLLFPFRFIVVILVHVISFSHYFLWFLGVFLFNLLCIFLYFYFRRLYVIRFLLHFWLDKVSYPLLMHKFSLCLLPWIRNNFLRFFQLFILSLHFAWGSLTTLFINNFSFLNCFWSFFLFEQTKHFFV